MQLDQQDKYQDALLALTNQDPAQNPDALTATAVAGLRHGLADSADLFGRLVMAARFGCTAVNEAMQNEEHVPGVAPAVMRAVRAAHTARLEAERRTREAAARAAAQPRRPNYYGGSSSGSQQAATQQQQAAPTQQRDPRQVFPCHVCNVKGHWKGDNACRPEDIRTNIARLAAMVGPPQLALPEHDGTGTSNHALEWNQNCLEH